jgi:hypothetical protein
MRLPRRRHFYFLAVLLSVLALIVAACRPVAHPVAGAKVGGGTAQTAYVTGYGWPDNSPPGPLTSGPRGTAGGIGTFADPITLAVGYTGKLHTPDVPYGTKFYEPNVRRYFVVDDTCSNCHRTPRNASIWVDMWVGGDGTNDAAVMACENKLTGNHKIIRDPSSDYIAFGAPLFDNATGTCSAEYGETAISIAPTPTPTPTVTVTPTITPTPTPTPSPVTGWGPQSWQYQLTGSFVLQPGVSLYSIDPDNGPATAVAQIHAAGAKAVCYFSAGTYENWRSDKGLFPASVIGNHDSGWAGESWIDVRQIAILTPIMTARIRHCAALGFDAVDPDNMDGYTNNPGFPITGAQQIAYNTLIASIAHANGLAVALKNDVDQLTQLQPVYDFAINEQCFQYSECSTYAPFIAAGKGVFNVEYNRSTCPAKLAGVTTILKTLELPASPRTACS